MIKILILKVAFLSVFFSAIQTEKTYSKYSEGKILQVDSLGGHCDWMIKVDSQFFKPINLDEHFKGKNSLIYLDFEPTLTKFLCGESDKEYDEIIIHWINIREN